MERALSEKGGWKWYRMKTKGKDYQEDRSLWKVILRPLKTNSGIANLL
jgi:hypothetical protein